MSSTDASGRVISGAIDGAAADGLRPNGIISTIRQWFDNAMVRLVGQYVGAAVYVGIADVSVEVLYQIAHVRRISMVFLAAVIAAAMSFGARPAIFAAVIAFGFYNHYINDPHHGLDFTPLEEVITIVIFLAVALATGGLAGRVRDESLRAKARANTNAVLAAASGEMSATAEEDRLRTQLVTSVARATDGEAILIDGPRRHAWPEQASFAPPPHFIAAALRNKPNEVELDDGWRARVVLLHKIDLGVILWRPGETAARAIDDLRALVNVLVDLAAASIARARLADEHAEAKAVISAERLQATLLSSISHDFRTPLSAILTSASGLLEYGDALTRETRIDLYTTIQEEAERLNRFVANLLNMTKIEAGVLEAEQATFAADEVINRVVTRLRRTQGDKQISWSEGEAPLMMCGDPVLMEHVLQNVIENALRFTAPDSPVLISGERRKCTIALKVTDGGPGVAEKDRERIFDKFYRVDGGERQQSAGLGLSIVKGLVEAMGGSARADARADGQQGLCVTLIVPAPS